jgi:hypothetical protein
MNMITIVINPNKHERERERREERGSTEKTQSKSLSHVGGPAGPEVSRRQPQH